MCDEEQVRFINKEFSSDERMIDDSQDYYVIVPKDPLLFGHIMIIFKHHCENLMHAKEEHLQVLNKAVIKWTNVLSKSFEDCRNVFLTCLCDSEKVHLHYHLFPVSNKDKIIRGHGHQWLGAHETISDMKRFDECSLEEKKSRVKYIMEIVEFLKEKAKIYST